MNLDFPWERAPDAADIQPLVAGLGWLRFPLPFALDHVNVWMLDTATGPLIIDTGIKSADTQAIWKSVLANSTHPPCGLLVTHYHPDHVGMAGWLAGQFDMPVWFSQQDLDYSREAYAISDADFSRAQDHWYQLHGLDDKRRAAMHHAGNTYRPNVHPLPVSPQRLQNNDVWVAGEHSWQVITVGGHAPEMICLYCTELNVLVAADQVLPGITPNVSLNHYTRDANPLQSFLDSLSAFEALPDDVLVLPSHGLPFRGLHLRIEQLRAHHHERFTRLLDACRQPSTAAGMLPVLFQRQLDYQQLMFAMGESVAHLRYLHFSGQLASSTEEGLQYYTSR